MRFGGLANLFLLFVGAVGVGSVLASTNALEKVNFGREILPLFSDKCFKCHGPDAGSRQAGLRLDTPEGAFAERGGRWAIVPGKPESSLVVQRINHADSPMPPTFSGKTLSKEEKELIARWIKEGAAYGKLWSFEPLPSTVSVPKVGGGWARSDIDRFIFDRLSKEGLKPSPPASRSRWLRRVTLDLTGLPPTEEEIASFERDKDPLAFEKVVDRLMASTRFGERLAVDWLDAARYSDSYGYQSDLLMPTWPYRDWVVRAFNENKPYDQFLIEQIGGDLLPNASRDQKLATAFNRLHRQSNEGGSIAEEFKTEYAVDRVDTFGTAVLGLTVGCARCHDHKFDPISQHEYYQLYAYFNSIEEFGLLLSTEIVPTPSLLLPTLDQEKKLDELRAKDEAAKVALRNAESRASKRYAESPDGNRPKLEMQGILGRFSLDEYTEKFKNEAGGNVSAAKIGKVDLVEGKSGKAALLDGDNGVVVRGVPAKERWDAFTWSFWLKDPEQKGPVVLLHRTGGTDVGFCGFDLMLEDGFLTARVMRHWPGNAVAVRAINRITKDDWNHVAWSWDGSGRASGLKLYHNGAPLQTRVLANKLWKKINAYGDLGTSGGEWAFGTRFRDAGFKGGKIDEIVVADRALSACEIGQLYDGAAPRTTHLDHYVDVMDADVQSARAEVRKTQKELTEFEEGIYEVSVMEEAKDVIPAYLLARGEYDAPKTEANRVARGVPSSLPALNATDSNNRLSLARWATAKDHPLTARVAVNRFWQMLFGNGLVETSENFGMQGARPTHPELLDYLARHFVDLKWDVKALLKELVLSSTYRQDSALSPKLLGKDPQNRLYARGPSGRLSAEMVRDTALFASDLLNPKLGGPPVNAYQPAGIWQEFNTMSPVFAQSTGTELYRRSLYSTWKRTTPVPNMMLFDATTREACTTRRQSTNTPMQALVLLNDVQFVEAARALAEIVLKHEATDNERIRSAFQRLAGREPTTREQSVLLKTLEEQRLHYRSRVSDAARLIVFGSSKPDPKVRPSELAAMTVTIQTILNSDAFIWKR